MSIVIVEDDPAIAGLLGELVNDVGGWSATVVHNGPVALEAFEHAAIDVLILDVNLPGIGGLDVLALLRRDPAWREPPVILLSAIPDQPEIRRAVERGEVKRFIPKPFDVDDVLDTIHAVVREA